MVNTQVAEIDDTDFSAVAESGVGPVLVEFWAEWCGVCMMMAPVLDKLATSHAGRLVVAKTNVAASAQAAERFGVASLPTLILFRDGEVRLRLSGAHSRKQLEEAVSPWL